jgi:hypothetical protein
MKKRMKKLALHRETLRSLQGSETQEVAGGSGDTSCQCFQATGCDCASQGGTDCYPPTACLGTCSWG